MEKHFELTENFIINAFGVKLFQIKATKNTAFANVGDLGGFIEKESNLSGNAWVSGNARVSGNALVSGNAWISGNSWVSGNALVSGNACVYGNALVSGNARVYGDDDLCWFYKFGSGNRTTTFFKTKKSIKVNCGCFQGTLEQFEKQVIATHKDNKYAKEYLAMIELVKIKFNL